MQVDITDTKFLNNQFKSIMFDPPFVIAGKTYKQNNEGSSVIAKRFEAFETFSDLKDIYRASLKQLYRILQKDGLLVFKCQDTVSGGKNHFTHCLVCEMAMDVGFYPKDLFILTSKNRLNSFGGRWKKQQHARKYHSYFWVFQKTKNKVSYEFR